MFYVKKIILLIALVVFCKETNSDESKVPVNRGGNGLDSAFSRVIHTNTLSIKALQDRRNHRDNPDVYVLQKEAEVLLDLNEGDILLDKKDAKLITENINKTAVNGTKRSVVMYARKLWITRIVPYEIQHPGTLNFDKAGVESEILKAFAEISKISCIKFRPKESADKNWLRFFKGSGCYSGIGRKYWDILPTEISLGDWCVHQSIIQHEILHSLGFFHEQSRADRDSFITIHWDNVIDSMKSNFDRHLSYDATIQETPYDYHSIMHYGKTAFTKNGEATIDAKFDKNMPLGGDSMSFFDQLELNKIYQCKRDYPDSSPNDAWSNWADFTVDCYMDWQKGCTRVRQRYCLSGNLGLCEGADQYGVQDDYKKCPDDKCNIELIQPHWGDWTPFDKCSLPCGEGIQTRKRECNNPPPHNGLSCVGHETQTAICRIRKCKMGPYDTDFEQGTISPWRQDRLEMMDWKVIKGPTESPYSGPEADHTTENGYYVYVSSTNTYQHNNQLGRIISPIIKANSGPLCLTFWYQMNGQFIVYLDVFIKMVGIEEYHTYWQRDWHQGDFWIRGATTIPNHVKDYEIMIEGKIGVAPHSDIAIDDIQVSNGKCIPGSEGCLDFHKSCGYWKELGECHKNYKWMLKSCCSTCEGMAECYDDTKYGSTNCRKWAEAGECSTNSKWMWKNCCKSCRGCLNKHDYCNWWAERGECEKSSWMKENCQTACKICKS